MIISIPTLSRTHSFWSFLPKVVRKAASAFGNTTLDEQTLTHLQRLALNSPHLLSDAGFARNAAISTPDKAVWSNEHYTIVIETLRPEVVVSAH